LDCKGGEELSKAKEYLEKIKEYDDKINKGLEDLAELEAFAQKMNQSLQLAVVTTSGSKDKLGETVTKMADLRTDLNTWTDAYLDLKRDALSLIFKLENTEKKPYFTVINNRYVLYQSWGDIAKELNYSERHIFNIHGHALVAFAKLMEENGQ